MKPVGAAFAASDLGSKRTTNDDSYRIDVDLMLYVVCDGMRSAGPPGEASQLCSKTIHEVVSQKKSVLSSLITDSSEKNRARIANILRLAVQTASTRIYQSSKADLSRRELGTTADILLFVQDRAFIAHVGDGRIYLLRKGSVHLLTTDHLSDKPRHSPGADAEEPSYAAKFLSRAVGPQELVEVDLLELEILPDDLFLVCTDGLSDFMSLADLKAALGSHDVSALPGALVKLAKERGSSDNITAMIVSPGPVPIRDSPVDLVKRFDLVSSSNLFKHLEYAEVIKLLTLAKVKTYSKGQMLMQEGSAASEMLLLASGNVEVLKGNQVLTKEGKGKIFGEMGLFDDAPRSASIRATQDTAVLLFERADLIRFLKANATIAVKFFWALNRELSMRLRETSQELALQKTKTRSEGSGPSDLPF